ncbi:TPA: Rha family transcriptional regulator, partial [Citrobacter freundii]|nr:Rha family transcriptional regulator [Citrobacter freundii]
MSQQEISIINLDQLVSMTSVEIAELTGKEHKHVLRDIRNMVEELNGSKTEQRDSGSSTLSSELNGSKFGRVGEEVYKDAKGESRTMYRLDRKHTFILVAGYSVHLRAKCYDHIQTLERRVLQLEEQKTRAAAQSANRRGVTWGDYCKTYGLPAQKLMTALLQHRGLFRKNPISNEWSV